MKKISKFVYWTPRILSIIFIFFLALMSLDVFSSESDLKSILIGLFFHNIPALFLLITLLISWRHEIVGGVVFILAGILYIVQVLINVSMGQFEWYMLSYVLMISGPAFLIGALFIMGWFGKRK